MSRFVLLALGFVGLLAASASAQGRYDERAWINVGFGGGAGMANFLAEGFYDGEAGMFGLCYTTASDLAGANPFGGSIRYSDDGTQIAGVYGIVRTMSYGHASIAGGPAFVYGQREKSREVPDPASVTGLSTEYYFEKFRGMGFTINAQAYLHFYKTHGIGLTYVQTFSAGRTWGTLNFAFSVGILHVD